MRELNNEEIDFLKSLLNYKPQKSKSGYYSYVYKKKKYKRSRVLMQLHLNKKLDITEFIHHINNNKEDDRIENLKVVNAMEHQYEHKKSY